MKKIVPTKNAGANKLLFFSTFRFHFLANLKIFGVIIIIIYFNRSQIHLVLYFITLYKANSNPKKTSQKHSGFSRGDLWTEIRFRVYFFFVVWGRGSVVSATMIRPGFKKLSQPVHRYRKIYKSAILCWKFRNCSSFISFTSWSLGKTPHFLKI